VIESEERVNKWQDSLIGEVKREYQRILTRIEDKQLNSKMTGKCRLKNIECLRNAECLKKEEFRKREESHREECLKEGCQKKWRKLAVALQEPKVFRLEIDILKEEIWLVCFSLRSLLRSLLPNLLTSLQLQADMDK
jgi:hypothetical protein